MEKKCNSCNSEKKVSFIFFSKSVKRKRNWEQEFLARKGITKDNNFQFCQQCQIEIKNYQAAEVVKELSHENLIDSQCFPPNYLKANNFTAEGAQKVQRAVTENIKRHSEEWKIIQAKLLNSDREYYHDWNGDYRNNELEILIHQSAQLEYGADRFLKRETNKMYLKEYFPSEQWVEIKKKLDNDNSTNNQFSNPPSNNNFFSEPVIWTIVLIAGLLIVLLILFKKKKKIVHLKFKNPCSWLIFY